MGIRKSEILIPESGKTILKTSLTIINKVSISKIYILIFARLDYLINIAFNILFEDKNIISII